MRRLLALLMAAALLASGSAFAQVSPTSSSKTLNAPGDVFLTVAGYGSAAIQIEGAWTGAAAFQCSVSGNTYKAINMTPPDSGTGVSSTTLNGIWIGNVAGCLTLNVHVTSITGLMYVTMQATVSGGSGAASSSSGSSTTTVVDGNGTSAMNNTVHALQVIGTGSGNTVPISPYDSLGNAISPSVCSTDTNLATPINFNHNTAANFVVLAGQANKKIYICAFALNANTVANTITIGYQTNGGSCAAPTAIDGPFGVNAGGTIGYPNTGVIQYSLPANADLCVTLGAAQTVGGHFSVVGPQ